MENIANPMMVVLARESRGMNQTELAHGIGVTQGKISKYESGILQVTNGDLKNIANVLEYTVDFFYQTDQLTRLGSGFIFNRKRKKVPISQQRKLQAAVNVLCMKVARLLRSFDIEHENHFESFDIDEYDANPSRVADALRQLWKVPQGPINSVTALIESAGGIVIKMPFETRLIDAVHLWPTGLPPLFFVNAELPGDRLRWTLAHEIGHAVMHRNPTIGDIEQQANEFTGEFLMPRNEIKDHLRNLTLERAAILKPHWKVSMASIIWRARDLGRISERQYRTLFTNLSAQGFRITEPYSIAMEEPQLLDQIYTSHIKELGYGQIELERFLFSPGPSDSHILPFDTEPLTPFYKPKKIAR